MSEGTGKYSGQHHDPAGTKTPANGQRQGNTEALLERQRRIVKDDGMHPTNIDDHGNQIPNRRPYDGR